jgi:transposase
VGLAETHLQHVFVAAAMNLSRIINWLNRPAGPLSSD